MMAMRRSQFRKAADQGDAPACTKPGNICRCGSGVYRGSVSSHKGLEDLPESLRKDSRSGSRIPFFRDLMAEENRIQGTRKTVYRRGDMSVTRVPKDAGSFRIYKRGTADDDGRIVGLK